jgi:hypothetical protein
MSRKNLLFALLAFLSIGWAHLAAAQNVSIELTPITYPIVLPDSGGSFDYLLTVTNQGSTPITATVWCMATLPNGSSWGPSLGPVSQTLGAGQTQSLYRTQTVPPRAPYGYYMLHAYVGIYPDTVWAQDRFEFQHQAINGTEQEWAARYNGPGNYDDWAKSLAVDGGGNVYVTGGSWGSGTDDDYATVKYDAWGYQVWAARYNGPGNYSDSAYSLAVDGGGNVYVTGRSYGSGTGYDYATVKYNTSGNQAWVARYDGPFNNDMAYSLAVDSGGNVYVTGESYGIAQDYTTIKYDSSGRQVWVARYNGPGNGLDIAYSLAVDNGGNVYVTGYSDGEAGVGINFDCATIKYDAWGNQVWAARYDNGYDLGNSLDVDDEGNVYVTGFSAGNGAPPDYTTIKYDSWGNQVWAASYNNGPGAVSDVAYSLAVDGAGNVHVTGYSYDSGNAAPDYATIKYDANGNQLWVARYNGPGNSADLAYSLARDGGGNVYVTGRSFGGWASGTGVDYATVKYDAWGNQVWVARYNGLWNFSDQANSLAVDGGGNVYVTGGSLSSGTYYDYATIKYSNGNIANWLPVEATVLGQPLPQEFALHQNYPNPFNAQTAISFQLSANSHVRLIVYDTAGRLVETLVEGWRSAGEHKLTFDASHLPSGMYFARLEAGDYVGVQKLILLK